MYPIPANATRIRYLDSTGTQYIDTGIVPTNNDIITTKFTALHSSNSGNGLFESTVGAWNANPNYWLLLKFNDNGLQLWSFSTYQRITTNSQYLNNITDCVINLNEKKLLAQIGATTINTTISVGTQSENQPSIKIFSANYSRLYSMRIDRLGATIADYVPVRVGQVGYLFDRVSGRLFGNAGTGDFVLGPDTFAQGVVPTRMMAMGVRKKAVTSYPWDYRVAYFQSDGTSTGFYISPMDLNSNIVNTNDCRAAVLQAFKHGRIVASAPSGAETGDRKITGGTRIIGVARYGTKWRPAGINVWPTQPTATEVPFYADVPTLFEWVPGSVTVSVPSKSKSKTISATFGIVDIRGHMFCCWDNAAGTNGARFYCESVSFSDPTYGFAWDVVPCVKGGVPYICDRLTGALYGKTGTGTITLGPKVADDYDAITNP